MSAISNRNRDCLGCRIFSGTGLIGIGAYVGFQARNNRTVPGRSLIYGISLAFACLGVARLANLPPFNKATATT